jgi:hypothetical protein
MQRAIRLSTRAKGAVLAMAAAGCAVGAGVASCVTSSPADVPVPPTQGPVIVQNSVMPAASAYLTAIPPDFIVPVRVFDPTKPIVCHVFIDFNIGVLPSVPCVVQPGLDGGITLAQFTVGATDAFDPGTCHTIQCFVANSFEDISPYTPSTSLGADSVTWQYTPNGPGGCDEFDGGDGAFPPADAPMDTLLLTPPDGV